MSALAAEVEAVEAEDMEVGLDYWLPGDVELQQMRLQQTWESFDPLSVLPWLLWLFSPYLWRGSFDYFKIGINRLVLIHINREILPMCWDPISRTFIAQALCALEAQFQTGKAASESSRLKKVEVRKKLR